MFRVEMLPAAHGDCLWIEWGKNEEIHRMLIDGGPGHTYPYLRERILHIPQNERVFELLVVTHIDGDHIEGVIRLIQDAPTLGVRFKRIWFNGREQLDKVPDSAGLPLGAIHGEYLSLLIKEYERVIEKKGTLNRDFPSSFIGIHKNDSELPKIQLPGGMKLTLLAPFYEQLLDLKDNWEEELRKAKLEMGDEEELIDRLENNKRLRPLGDVLGDDEEWEEEDRFEIPYYDDRDIALDVLGGTEKKFGSDKTPANGSSIVLLAEYEKHKALLAGDTHARVLEESLDLWLSAYKKSKLSVDIFKIPHHGSMNNITKEVLGKLSCRHYFISTSGASSARHPHEEAIELIISEHQRQGKPRLHFNYLTLTTIAWSEKTKQKEQGFVAHYPMGVSLTL